MLQTIFSKMMASLATFTLGRITDKHLESLPAQPRNVSIVTITNKAPSQLDGDVKK
jgi:hypothetical protein